MDRLNPNMATNASKREASTVRPTFGGVVDNRKKAKQDVENSESDTDGDGDGEGDMTSDLHMSEKGKAKGKKNSETHPHRCEFPGCERAYTRAEHLHRHQLEHKFDSKHLKCSFPDCNFGCVRRDLLERHLERHKREGSNLWRRDQKRGGGRSSKGGLRAATGRKSQHNGRNSSDESNHDINGSFQVDGTTHISNAPLLSPISPSISSGFGVGHASNMSPVSPVNTYPPQPLMQPQASALNGFGGSRDIDTGVMSTQYYQAPSSMGTDYYVAPRPRGPDPSMIPNFDQTSAMSGPGPDIMAPTGIEIGGHDPFGSVIDSVNQQQPGLQVPMTGNFDPMTDFDETAMMPWIDDFNFGFFNNNMLSYQQHRSWEPDKFRRQQALLHAFADVRPPVETHDGSSETSADGPLVTPGRPITPIHTLLGPNAISSDKYRQIYDFIDRKFENVPIPKTLKVREHDETYFGGIHITEANRLNQETQRYLTQGCLDAYLESYWRDYAPQIPIIHPSLDPSRKETEVLLLLAMIAIGATSADHQHKKAENEIAAFIAWNLRTRVLNHIDVVCPTKTWVLQTLVLLEIFEKLFTTRLLHERSHQFHGLTIELARRSEYFEGPMHIEVDPNNLKASWQKFVEDESRKRAAYTIFATDAFHACMFSHKPMVKFQEIELAVPCSDSLWECKTESGFYSAFKSTENQTDGPIIKKTLSSYGDLHKRLLGCGSLSKFDALLKNYELHQNKFAFKVILAGTISVFREINKGQSQTNCLSLLSHLEAWIKKSTTGQRSQDSDLAELYSICSLAQINLRSSVVFLQQIAFPDRILGKQVTYARRKEAWKQIRRWVRNSVEPSPDTLPEQAQAQAKAPASPKHASNAVCSAARYLTYVFAKDTRRRNSTSIDTYTPVGDHFLHRPWAVYISFLCIWAFAYTYEGPIPPPSIVYYTGIHDSRVHGAANRFLDQLSRIENPEQLKNTKDLNRCLGVLTIMSSLYHSCQWELLREVGDRMQDCSRILKGELRPVDDWPWHNVSHRTLEEEEEYAREWEAKRRNLKARIEMLQLATSKRSGRDSANARSISQGFAAKESSDSRSQSGAPL